MIVLITIFAVGLVGVVLMVVFKVAEHRTGKNLFLFDWMVRKEPEFEKATHTTLRRAHYGVGSVFVRVYRSAANMVRALVTHQKHAILRQSEASKPLEKNGSGSFFMKHINDHKNDVRRENGYHDDK